MEKKTPAPEMLTGRVMEMSLVMRQERKPLMTVRFLIRAGVAPPADKIFD